MPPGLFSDILDPIGDVIPGVGSAISTIGHIGDKTGDRLIDAGDKLLTRAENSPLNPLGQFKDLLSNPLVIIGAIVLVAVIVPPLLKK